MRRRRRPPAGSRDHVVGGSWKGVLPARLAKRLAARRRRREVAARACASPRRRRGRVVVRRGDRAVVYRGRAWGLVLAGVLVALSVAAVVAGFVLVGAAVVGVVLVAWLGLAFRLTRLAPAGPGGGGPAPPGGAGVREPRRPMPLAPAGAAAIPLPPDEIPPRRAVALG